MICQTVSLSTRSATIDVDGLKLNIGIAHGLHNARKLLEDIKAGKSQFHAIEIMVRIRPVFTCDKKIRKNDNYSKNLYYLCSLKFSYHEHRI